MTQVDGKATIHLSLPSRPDFVATLHGFFTSLGVVCDLDEDASVAVATAVIEAATNAVQHGNRFDETKRIDIAVKVLPDALQISVRDMGPGFDASILDRGLPDNLFAERGRGIALMRALMDDVAFDSSSSGTTVRLTKQIPSASGD